MGQHGCRIQQLVWHVNVRLHTYMQMFISGKWNYFGMRPAQCLLFIVCLGFWFLFGILILFGTHETKQKSANIFSCRKRSEFPNFRPGRRYSPSVPGIQNPSTSSRHPPHVRPVFCCLITGILQPLMVSCLDNGFPFRGKMVWSGNFCGSFKPFRCVSSWFKYAQKIHSCRRTVFDGLV